MTVNAGFVDSRTKSHTFGLKIDNTAALISGHVNCCVCAPHVSRNKCQTGYVWISAAAITLATGWRASNISYTSAWTTDGVLLAAAWGLMVSVKNNNGALLWNSVLPLGCRIINSVKEGWHHYSYEHCPCTASSHLPCGWLWTPHTSCPQACWCCYRAKLICTAETSAQDTERYITCMYGCMGHRSLAPAFLHLGTHIWILLLYVLLCEYGQPSPRQEMLKKLLLVNF